LILVGILPNNNAVVIWAVC